MIEELIVGTMGLCIALLFLVIMGKGEIRFRLMKLIGMMKGKIIANELKKDGKVYRSSSKIDGSEIKIGKENRYDYDIKQTAVNNMDLREGYFSEITGKQLPIFSEGNPHNVDPRDASRKYMMATAMAMMPKPSPFSSRNIPWLILIIGLVVVVLALTGNLNLAPK
jgi:hypothetical protein